jgi:hypothetical protein
MHPVVQIDVQLTESMNSWIAEFKLGLGLAGPLLSVSIVIQYTVYTVHVKLIYSSIFFTSL